MYCGAKPWGHGATFSCVCNATLLHSMSLEDSTVEMELLFTKKKFCHRCLKESWVCPLTLVI